MPLQIYEPTNLTTFRALSSIERLYVLKFTLWGIVADNTKVFRIKSDSKFFKIYDVRFSASNPIAQYDIFINSEPSDQINVETSLRIKDVTGVYVENNIKAFGFGGDYVKEISTTEKEVQKVFYIGIDNLTDNVDEIEVLLVLQDLDP